MIECRDYQLEISALLDGESDPATALELLEHVAACRSCGDAVREFRAAQVKIDRAFAPAEPVPTEVVPLRRRGRGPGRHWAWGMAATIAMAVGGYVAIDNVRSQGPTGTSGDGEIVVRLGADPGAMSDDRFFELTTELLRADRSYRDQMYSVLETVRTGGPQEGERVTEGVTEPGRGREAAPERPVLTVALD